MATEKYRLLIDDEGNYYCETKVKVGWIDENLNLSHCICKEQAIEEIKKYIASKNKRVLATLSVTGTVNE